MNVAAGVLRHVAIRTTSCVVPDRCVVMAAFGLDFVGWCWSVCPESSLPVASSSAALKERALHHG